METPLFLYNSYSRTKEAFKPLDEKNVRMYVCGPTVYDRAHIGNARPVLVFDILFRLLRYLYKEDNVTYVRNITDIDDKINAKALERGVNIAKITEETIELTDPKAVAEALGLNEKKKKEEEPVEIEEEVDLESLETGK